MATGNRMVPEKVSSRKMATVFISLAKIVRGVRVQKYPGHLIVI
jgi:hypothetical protein